MRDEVKGLKGGKKQFWLRVHRKEVENYYSAYGPEATMSEFNISADTLERFFQRKNGEINMAKLSEADRWVLTLSQEGLRELKGRVKNLEDWQQEMIPIFELGKNIASTLSGLDFQVKVLPKKRTLPPHGNFTEK